MGNDISRGFSAVGNTMREGLGAWFDPTKRSMILGQVAKRLPTLHQDIQRQANEVSPALGMTAKVASGLLNTLPVGQLAQSVLGNVAKGSVGGLIGDAITARSAKPGTYTMGVSGTDLAGGIAKEYLREPSKSKSSNVLTTAESTSEPYTRAERMNQMVGRNRRNQIVEIAD